MFQEFLDAVMNDTPEGQSKALYILQGTLGKQREVIQAARELIASKPEEVAVNTIRLEKALRKYDKL